jgi:hypothetical protein
MSSYEFSWYEQIKTPYIQKRKWWNIFGLDDLAYKNSWVVKRHTITDPKLVELLMSHSGISISELNKLIFTDKTVSNLCLTEGPRTTPYISTRHGEG